MLRLRADYLEIGYQSDLRQQVATTAAIWQEFCGLPLEEKRSLTPDTDSDSGYGSGYEIKDGSGNKGDRKENCDITLAMGKRLNPTHPTAQAFLRSAVELVYMIQPTVIQCARFYEEGFNVAGLVDELQNADHPFFIRFLHYFGGRKPGDELATPHVDKGGATPHLYESAPGFQWLDRDGVWQDISSSPESTIVLPGMQMQLRSEGRLTATCHRVIATEETAETGRFSVVCFVDLPKTPKYDKARWGRLQEFQAGFNYRMRPEEFSKLFHAR